jgi:aminodeoxyfutalosine deaminase
VESGSLRALALALPKVELHVHLEGAMRPETLLRLARRRGVTLPADDEAGLRRWFRFRDFEHFVEIYLTCSRCLRDPEDFQLLAADFVEEQARQNILHSEVHFTISTHLGNGVNGDEVAAALDETFSVAGREGTHIRLIPDIVRNVGPAAADATLEWALSNRSRGVVALGLSGFESEPNAPYKEHFEVAAEEGLHRVAHAGEHGGPESIRSALEICGAERLGHGVRAVEDPSLLEDLARRRIPLEVCPTSNVCLGVSRSLATHPWPQLVAAGARVTINSDDPPLFDTTLSDEYLRLAETFALQADDLAFLARQALQASFAEDPLARELSTRMQSEFARLGVDPEASKLTGMTMTDTSSRG